MANRSWVARLTTDESDATLPAGDGCEMPGDGVPLPFDVIVCECCCDACATPSLQVHDAGGILVA